MMNPNINQNLGINQQSVIHQQLVHLLQARSRHYIELQVEAELIHAYIALWGMQHILGGGGNLDALLAELAQYNSNCMSVHQPLTPMLARFCQGYRCYTGGAGNTFEILANDVQHKAHAIKSLSCSYESPAEIAQLLERISRALSQPPHIPCAFIIQGENSNQMTLAYHPRTGDWSIINSCNLEQRQQRYNTRTAAERIFYLCSRGNRFNGPQAAYITFRAYTMDPLRDAAPVQCAAIAESLNFSPVRAPARQNRVVMSFNGHRNPPNNQRNVQVNGGWDSVFPFIMVGVTLVLLVIIAANALGTIPRESADQNLAINSLT